MRKIPKYPTRPYPCATTLRDILRICSIGVTLSVHMEHKDYSPVTSSWLLHYLNVYSFFVYGHHCRFGCVQKRGEGGTAAQCHAYLLQRPAEVVKKSFPDLCDIGNLTPRRCHYLISSHFHQKTSWCDQRSWDLIYKCPVDRLSAMREYRGGQGST
ncbi:hypothetical protein GGU11DRAFT_802717 [Lentinula aff. detonsa]|nr:hypothetical protein GGU11DRAFT_802717 [Lentinula aff. detonsa]